MYTIANIHVYMHFQEPQIQNLTQKCAGVFPIEDGPFIVALDNTLKEMKVHREAYYGRTFTGNHAHKWLQVS